LHYLKKGKNMNQDNTSSDNENDSPEAIMKSRQFPTLLMQAEPSVRPRGRCLIVELEKGKKGSG
jgi:hypothetical protein